MAAVLDLVGNRTLRDLLSDRTARHPSKTFLICQTADGRVTELSYAHTLQTAQDTAAALAQLGIGHGDTVVLQLANSREFVTSWLGIMWLGAVAVPANTANTATELAHVLSHSEAVAIITSPDHLDTVQQALPAAAPTGIRLLLTRTDTRVAGAIEGAVLLDDLITTAADTPVPDAPLAAEDIAEFIFTSGTTAKPKAVMLTHANCLRAGEQMARSLALDSTDRLLTALPAFHVNAQAATLLAALTVGGSCVLLEEYRASQFWGQLRAHQATAVSLVAMQLRTLLVQPARPGEREHRLRRCFYAINVSTAEKDAFEQRYGVELINAYGLSEAMMIVTIAPVFGAKHWPSIGLPADDRQLRIVDEHGQDVPPGTPGEILVAGTPGRSLMAGYYNDPHATAQALRDGWLHTGDNGYIDQAGFVYFFDRKKDVIKRAGENISASEVEAALLTHPRISEAAVIGIPDPVRDEAVHAFIVATCDDDSGDGNDPLDIDDVLKHCRAQLAAFKVPTSVQFLPELPKTSIGKIEKKLLRQLLTGQPA